MSNYLRNGQYEFRVIVQMVYYALGAPVLLYYCLYSRLLYLVAC